MSFLDPNYEIPKSSGLYAKLESGDNKFMILSSVVLGWQYWNTEKKCIRLQEKPKDTPVDLGTDDNGKPKRVQHFWAFAVYNFANKEVQILEITQKGLMGALQDLARDKDWGDPILSYQITIKKSGQKLDTTYQVLPVPFKGDIKDIKLQYEESDIDMKDYFVEKKQDNPMETSNPYEIDEIANDIKM